MKNYFVFLLLAVTTVSFGQSAGKLVRQGNRDYNSQKYDEAKLKYREALGKDANMNQANYNLGNTNYRQKEYEEAANRYSQAIKTTNDPQKLTNYYYNLGNALYNQEKLKASIEAYKQALRYDPKNVDAKHNLSLAIQKLNQQQQQQQQKDNNSKPPEPSEFAKKLKQEAQALVNERKYTDAYKLMVEGEKQDPTVAYYKDFTNKIKEVDDINQIKP